ncbi:MAG: hypothetical protein ACJ78Y_13750, partial [Myxococcales bacterium]
PEVRSAAAVRASSHPSPSSTPPRDEKYDLLVGQLDANGWNVTNVARAMGKARSHVQRLMRRYGIKALPVRRRDPPT